MGNRQSTPPQPPAVATAGAHDAEMSDDPLYVLYGAPSCGACVDAANLLAEREAHHCKIGPALLTEAMAGAAAASASGAATIPQVFSCPCAELLAAEAGSAPGALGATAHGAVAKGMCRHVGGLPELFRHLNESGGGGGGGGGATVFKTHTI